MCQVCVSSQPKQVRVLCTGNNLPMPYRQWQSSPNVSSTTRNYVKVGSTNAEERSWGILRLGNYYRRFIENYSAKAHPLIDLTKDVQFGWRYQRQQGFDMLRTWFLCACILTQFDRRVETSIDTDASNQAIGGILSQYHIVNRAKELHPVEYYANTLSAAQRNWHIYYKELLAFVDAFCKWRDWLVGVEVNIYTD